jgi:hypothetical protein
VNALTQCINANIHLTQHIEPATSTAAQKKSRKIRWADSTGENLAVSQGKTEVKEAVLAPTKSNDPRVNRWAKKKDVSQDREMLLQAR